MKDIKIHYQYNNNLASIKAVDDNHFDRVYLSTVIRDLFSRLSHSSLHVIAGRRNFDVSDLITKLQAMLGEKVHLGKGENLEIRLLHNEVNDEVLATLPSIWFAFEHVTFLLLGVEKLEIDIQRSSWKEITSEFRSYMFFRGPEEDVVWIGKSDNLRFDLSSQVW